MKARSYIELLVLLSLSLLALGTSNSTHAQTFIPKNKCVFSCPALAGTSELEPVCGSDGHPYPSRCMLKYKSCLHPERVNAVPVASSKCAFFGVLTSDDPRLQGIMPIGIRPVNLVVHDDKAEGENPDGHLSDSSSSGGSEDDDGDDGDDGSTSPVNVSFPTLTPMTHSPIDETHDLDDDETEYDDDNNSDDSSDAGSSGGGDDDDVSENEGTSLHCETMCLTNYDPVCASDGKTYSNRCELKVAKCLDPKLTEVHTGDCSHINPGTGTDLPQALPEPPNTPYQLALKPDEKGYDPCAYVCPMFDAPVCSEDGHVYDNKCVFASAFCRDSMLEDATAEICKSA